MCEAKVCGFMYKTVKILHDETRISAGLQCNTFPFRLRASLIYMDIFINTFFTVCLLRKKELLTGHNHKHLLVLFSSSNEYRHSEKKHFQLLICKRCSVMTIRDFYPAHCVATTFSKKSVWFRTTLLVEK